MRKRPNLLSLRVANLVFGINFHTSNIKIWVFAADRDFAFVGASGSRVVEFELRRGLLVGDDVRSSLEENIFSWGLDEHE